MNGNYPDVSKTSRIRWNAIFAGVFLATVVGILLNMLGLGIGLTNLELDPDTMTNISMGSAIWWTFSGIIAMFVAGWATVRLSNISDKLDSVLNALTAWSLSTLLGLLFVGSALGMIISGTGNLISGGISAATQAASQSSAIVQAANNSNASMSGPISQVTSQAEDLIDQAAAKIKKSGSSVDQVTRQFNQAIGQWLNAGNSQDQQQAQQQVVNLLTKYTNLSQDQAQNTVQKWQQTYNQAQQKAEEMTEQAGNVMGTVAIIGFIILLLGAISASIGGIVGGRSKQA